MQAAAVAAIIMAVGAAGWLRSMWPNGFPRYVALYFRTRRQQRTRHLTLRLGYGVGCGLLTALIGVDLTVALPAALVCGLLTLLLPSWQPSRRP